MGGISVFGVGKTRIVEKTVPKEPVQAPIVGRKKKTKKSLATNTTANSTPAHSRPQSPAAKQNVADLEKTVVDVPTKEAKKESKKDVPKPEEKKAAQVSAVPQATTVPDPSQKGSITPASIIADLLKSGELDSVGMLQHFNSVPGLNYRHDITSADFPALDRKVVLSDEQRGQLAQGSAVHLVPSTERTSSRVMVSPAGAILRGLSEDQEQRFIELEKRTMSVTGPAKFNPGRHGTAIGRSFQTYHDVSSNGGTQQGAASDPMVGRKLDEASNYVNQFLDATPLSDGGAQKLKTGYEAEDAGHKYQSARAQLWSEKPLMSVEEAEAAMLVARKETEALSSSTSKPGLEAMLWQPSREAFARHPMLTRLGP